MRSSFQSLIGRLKTDLNALYLAATRGFQSLIGRLKTSDDERGNHLLKGFNPS